FLPFQDTVQRKRKYDIAEKALEIPLKLFCFELLYADGVNFIHSPFIERRKRLEEIIQTTKNISKDTVLIAPHELISEGVKIELNFEDAIARGLEGIIAKKLDGIYQPGARGWNWIKFKRSYSSKIEDTIDCVVMGYDAGKGKRTDFGIGAFLVGVYDNKQENYVTIAKIGTGLTDMEWKELKVKSSKLKVNNKPEEYFVDKGMKCDVWVNPSIVVEIKADEITKSPIHTAHLALRFPRLERFRDDKKADDTTTLSEMESMFTGQGKTR
ncbi:MAG: ATP-dependent DNA ligase, partial [Patescibacteria group bacterium]